MAEKNFVSFNLKAKKKAAASKMIGHLAGPGRSRSPNVVAPAMTKYNVTSAGMAERYREVTAKVEAIKGKRIQANANFYLEGVMAFSHERVAEIGYDAFRRQAPALLEAYGRRMAEEYGFEYLGFSLHFDEGQIEYQVDENGRELLDGDGKKIPVLDARGQPLIKRDEQGRPKLNVHAHINFVNFDFSQKKARFRELQKRLPKGVPNHHFVKMQDMAGEVFEPLGFERGQSKEITGLSHLEKSELVRRKELEAQTQALEERIEELQQVERRIESLGQRQVARAQQAVSALEAQSQELSEQIVSQQGLLVRLDEAKKAFLDWVSDVRDRLWARAPESAKRAAETIVEAGGAIDQEVAEGIERDHLVPDSSKLSSAIQRKLESLTPQQRARYEQMSEASQQRWVQGQLQRDREQKASQGLDRMG